MFKRLQMGLLGSLLCGLMACGEGGDPPTVLPFDAGATSDAGSAQDAGVTQDAGSTSDAGPGQDAGFDPYAQPAVCTTNSTWSGGNNENMRPGQACISCHVGNNAPDFEFAGTVYPTAHEPQLCNSQTFTGLQIILTGKNGDTQTLTQRGSAGNFSGSVAVSKPYTAKLLYQGRERAMTTPQTSGDCNSCHTQNGASGAKGRLLLP